MHLKLFLALALTSLFLGGCEKDAAEKTLDTDILVSAEMDDRNIMVVAESEKIYPCMNFQISNSLQKSGNTYIIKFTDVLESEFCLTATGPARARIGLGSLSPGSYPLVFQLNGVSTTATMEVDSAASIQIKQQRNVKIK